MNYKDNMIKFQDKLSIYACPDSKAIRLKNEESDFRTPFFRDVDRIIYSLSYTRYLDKTQVFSNNDNTNISKRIIHVQLVSKIARTIGRALKLNEDLIEAAGLGHDLGHVPFGHVGERILNDISLKHNEGYFNHNIESVRDLMFIEKKGQGCNLTLQVLDAIMCHNGEAEFEKYVPRTKTKEEFLEEYYASYKDKKVIDTLVPMTLEGCVVRISDIIAYVGKDIEDAIRLHVLSKEELPSYLEEIGYTNGEIVNAFILDIIKNSYDKPYISMSSHMFNILKSLKKFNYEHIYLKINTEEEIANWQKMFETVFDYSLKAIKEKNIKTDIYKVFLNDMSDDYLNNTSDERKVIDFIAGMTDNFLVNEYRKIVRK